MASLLIPDAIKLTSIPRYVCCCCINELTFQKNQLGLPCGVAFLDIYKTGADSQKTISKSYKSQTSQGRNTKLCLQNNFFYERNLKCRKVTQTSPLSTFKLHRQETKDICNEQIMDNNF